MRLSIITINYNNASGLRKTLTSVASQTYRDIEHIIIDGGSKDGSVEAIKEYVAANSDRDPFFKHTIKWVSEKDSGIYNAMNKGIEVALGRRIVNSFNRSERSEDKNKLLPDYIQILNSGDILAAPDVTDRMMDAIAKVKSEELRVKSGDVDILYGNMIKKDYATGKILGKSKEVEYSLRQYYTSTMNHDCCYIRCDVYDKYGLYDESLKIVSDWKWFLQAVGLGQVKPEYVDIDVTIFDASGISESNLELRNKERRQVLEDLLSPAVMADYDKYGFPMEQYNRLRKHRLWGLTWFVERILFKLEKWHILKR
jgi:glycosyltransferase involved in cell wall biosynthesis